VTFGVGLDNLIEIRLPTQCVHRHEYDGDISGALLPIPTDVAFEPSCLCGENDFQCAGGCIADVKAFGLHISAVIQDRFGNKICSSEADSIVPGHQRKRGEFAVRFHRSRD
jgi:hypothetical protein